jgi:hypothetical protein
LGDDDNATIEYDESGSNKLEITCTDGIIITGSSVFVNDVIPGSDGNIDIGTIDSAFQKLYVEEIENPNGSLTINDSILLSADGTLSIGNATNALNTVYVGYLSNPNDSGWTTGFWDGSHTIKFKWDGSNLKVKVDSTEYTVATS